MLKAILLEICSEPGRTCGESKLAFWFNDFQWVWIRLIHSDWILLMSVLAIHKVENQYQVGLFQRNAIKFTKPIAFIALTCNLPLKLWLHKYDYG